MLQASPGGVLVRGSTQFAIDLPSKSRIQPARDSSGVSELVGGAVWAAAATQQNRHAVRSDMPLACHELRGAAHGPRQYPRFETRAKPRRRGYRAMEVSTI